MKTPAKLKPYRTRSRLGTREFLTRHGFKDSRSYVETKTGRVVLRGVDYKLFRFEIFKRAGGRCELVKANGKRCNKFAQLDGVGHGELAHTVHRKRGGSDAPDNVLWSCGQPDSCHRNRDHPGPQWSKRRRALEAGENPAQPATGLDADV